MLRRSNKRRSPEMYLVGYFLSRCGDRQEIGSSKPPRPLNVGSWQEAYMKFFPTLGEGRTQTTFINSLLAVRSGFDT